MKQKGQASGPFQLLIGIVVFGMALTIGAFLFDMIQCWQCNELLASEVIDLRESLASVGKGDTNSKKSILVELEDLGGCAKGIYLKQIKTSSGLNCRNFCPNHPNNCWAIVTESTCGDQTQTIECIDISGDTQITADPDLLGTVQTSENRWIEDSFSFSHTVLVKIEKMGPDSISIGKP